MSELYANIFMSSVQEDRFLLTNPRTLLPIGYCMIKFNVRIPFKIVTKIYTEIGMRLSHFKRSIT